MRKLLAVLPALALTACAVGPNYKPPAPPPPAATGAFQTAVPGTVQAPLPDNWWRLYDDPALDGLVRRALAANTDLRVAEANLRRAQLVLREARVAFVPDGSVSAGADYDDGSGNSNGQGGFQQGGSTTQWSYNGGLSLSWEADLFGRLRRTIEATRADAEAAQAARDRVAVTVAAETARAYTDACALGEAVAVARESIGIAERQLTLQRQRERAGAASRLDSERTATQLAQIQAALPGIEGRREAALFELAALLGATPADIPAEARACARAPAPLAQIPVGDGQGLLARRPDVREAERMLAADTARIGVEVANLYPRITLGGSGNFFRNDQVRGGDSFTFSLGPLISWSFTDLVGGRFRIKQAEATAQASLATFDGRVLTALKEVEQALSYYGAELRRNDRLKDAAVHAEAAYDLARQRQRAGSISTFELLDSQRALLDARSTFASSNQQLGSYRVDLFKALGGGWQAVPGPN